MFSSGKRELSSAVPSVILESASMAKARLAESTANLYEAAATDSGTLAPLS